MKIIVLALVLLIARVAHAQELISYTQEGIRIGDGLITDQIDSVAYDPAQELIWFVDDAKLQVIDLRAKDRTPVVIATGWPQINVWQITGTSVAEFMHDRDALRYPILAWGKSPKIKVSGGKARFLSADGDTAAKQDIKKIKLVGKKWLKKHRKRKARKVARPGATVKAKVTLTSLDRCKQTEQCGTAYQLTKQLQLVVAYTDTTPVGCVLHDPATGLFTDPTPDPGGAGGAWAGEDGEHLRKGPCYAYGVSDDQQSYAVDGFRCTISSSGVACQYTEGTTYLGWTAPAAN